MTVEIVERNGRVIVSALYNAEWRAWANTHGGRWNAGSKAWTFPRERREDVEAALVRIFEEDEA